MQPAGEAAVIKPIPAARRVPAIRQKFADDGRSVTGGQQNASLELGRTKMHAHVRNPRLASEFLRNLSRQSTQRSCDEDVRAMMPRPNAR